ncbi:MAG: alpha/beta hydrolase [Burkholderiales bacterium]
MLRILTLLLAAAAGAISTPVPAQEAPQIGVVVMHGKGGNPSGIIKPLADGLAAKGFLVTSLEMPWSKRRSYDRDVATAVQEVSSAISALRGKGAKKVFVAGHSQGAVFAIYYATRQPPDGLIVIAPGGNVGTAFYQGKVGGAVSQAREMLESGKGGETGDFDEFEGGRSWTVRTTAASYFSWFDPQGAMNQMKSSAALPKSLPVLHVAPTSDYPALLRAKQEMFDALPDHPLKKLHEPGSDHRNAPRDSVDEIARWITQVAAK